MLIQNTRIRKRSRYAAIFKNTTPEYAIPGLFRPLICVAGVDQTTADEETGWRWFRAEVSHLVCQHSVEGPCDQAEIVVCLRARETRTLSYVAPISGGIANTAGETTGRPGET